MWETIEKILRENGFAQGGLLVMSWGVLLGFIYKIWGWIRILFLKLFFIEIKSISSDTNFHYLQHWIHNTKYAKKYCSNLLVSSYANTELYNPSYGRHIFIHKKRLYIVYYSVEADKNVRTENIQISALSLFKKRLLATQILEEGKKLAKTRVYEGTNIWINNGGGYWERHLLRKNSFTPILTNSFIYDNLSTDIELFQNNEGWYLEKGVNYKRNYLFYGPPGNGKTTCVLSLAQKFQKDLCILNLGDAELTEKQFLYLISSMPSNSWLCIEDVDATKANVQERKPKKLQKNTLEMSSVGTIETTEGSKINFSSGRKNSSNKESISLSTILNAFDGFYTPHGLVSFMTTNYVDKLDSALLRKGRIDYRLELENANEYQIVQLYNKYFTSNTTKLFFIKWALGKPMSEVHAKLIEYKDDIHGLETSVKQS